MQLNSSVTVLLTRSRELNQITIEEINNLALKSQFNFLACNLINYQLASIDYLIFKKNNYFIITSYFAALHFPTRLILAKAKNIFVVGNKSAKILRQKGHNIIYIAKDAIELTAKLNIYQQERAIMRDKIIYLSSNYITVAMPIFVKRVIFYHVHYKQKLNIDEIACLKMPPDYILVYSENSAKTLLQLLIANNLLIHVKKSVILAISEKVAKIFKKYLPHIQSFQGKSEAMLHFLVNANIIDHKLK